MLPPTSSHRAGPSSTANGRGRHVLRGRGGRPRGIGAGTAQLPVPRLFVHSPERSSWATWPHHRRTPTSWARPSFTSREDLIGKPLVVTWSGERMRTPRPLAASCLLRFDSPPRLGAASVGRSLPRRDHRLLATSVAADTGTPWSNARQDSGREAGKDAPRPGRSLRGRATGCSRPRRLRSRRWRYRRQLGRGSVLAILDGEVVSPSSPGRTRPRRSGQP